MDVPVPHSGPYTLNVAPPSVNFVTHQFVMPGYSTDRKSEQWFPRNDTSKTTVCFSFDAQPLDFAYYLEVYAQSGSPVFTGYVYDNHSLVNLAPGAYQWRVYPLGLENGYTVWGNASPLVFFNAGSAISSMEDLLGTNPLAPSDPGQTPLAYPEDTLEISPGVLLVSDAYHNVIKKLEGGRVTVFIGTGIGGYNGDGDRTSVQISLPSGMALAPDGSVTFVDNGNHLIRNINVASGQVTTIAGVPGVLGKADSNQIPQSAAIGYGKFVTYHGGSLLATVQFPHVNSSEPATSNVYVVTGNQLVPYSVTAHTDNSQLFGMAWFGNFFYLMTGDTTQVTLRKFTLDGAYTNLGSFPALSEGIFCFGEDDLVIGGHTVIRHFVHGTSTEVGLNFANVVQIRSADSGHLYVVDSDGGTVTKASISDWTSVNIVTRSKNSFSTPVDVAIEDSDHVLVLMNQPAAIFRYNIVNGRVDHLAGNGGLDYAVAGINALNSPMRYPNSIAVDAQKNVYVVEQDGILKIDHQTNILSIFAGKPSISGYQTGDRLSAEFASIHAIRFDPAGNLYVADFGNNRIRRVNVDGSVTTIAGDGTIGFGIAPNGSAALSYGINGPSGVMPYSNGCFVGVSNDNYVQWLAPGGSLWTAAGRVIHSGYQGSGSYSEGYRLDAQFNTPVSLSQIGTGADLLVTDSFNNCIRRVNSGTSTVVGDRRPGFSSTSLNLPTTAISVPGGIIVTDSGNGLVRFQKIAL